MIVQLGQIIDALGGELIGAERSVRVSRIAPLETADAVSISFLSNPKYAAQMAASGAACVIVAPSIREAAIARGACIVAANPYVYFAKLTQFWRMMQKTRSYCGVHPSAVVDPSAEIAASAWIGPGCIIGANAKIGEHSKLTSRITVADDCEVGARCLLHPGVVIGADGFGFANDAGVWVKIEQLGCVRIGNDVEIGANTCIDRGALDDTIIEDGVKIDNLVQIAHNVHIGAHSVIAGNVGIAGSARIGKHCSIGGAANILGHLSIADGTSISPTSMVTRSLHQPDLYTGIFPLQTNAQWEKNAASLKQLHVLRERIKKLEMKLQAQDDSDNGNS